MAKLVTVNPWTWQEPLGFSHGCLVTEAKRVLYCAGQTSVDANGAPLHAGNMQAQFDQAMANLETVLKGAEMTLASLVRLNYYVTDMAGFLAISKHVAARMERVGISPPGTLLGVSALFHPDILIEIEATAAAA
jgi:enamine deaminase RidA (YjgF/YER057c/UK114 family)